MADLTLDLHGRRVEEAIAEVTIYFDRIRRTHASINNTAANNSSLNVTIITGKGSHSANGPVLRSAVHKLLVKRGMTFTMENGKGAFKVDALSGWDLYTAGVATDSKILTSDQQEFYLLAESKKNPLHGASFHQAATGNCAPSTKLSRNQQEVSKPQDIIGPLPKHVALEMEAFNRAQRQSQIEAQKQKAAAIKEKHRKRHELSRAMEESKAECAMYDRCREHEDAELKKVLALSSQISLECNACINSEADDLKCAIEQSLIEEERRKERDELFENELNKVLEQSAQSETTNKLETSQEEIDLLKVLELSLKENEMINMSEEDAIHKAIQLSEQSNILKCTNKLWNEMSSLVLEEPITYGQEQQITVIDAPWFYTDPKGNVQGPYESEKMKAWLQAGCFNGEEIQLCRPLTMSMLSHQTSNSIRRSSYKPK